MVSDSSTIPISRSRERLRSGIRVATRPGLYVLALAGFTIAIHLWLASSVLVPIARDQGLEYVLVSASFRSFVVLVGMACAVVLATHLLVRLHRLRRAPALFTAPDVAYVAPLFWLAASCLGLLNLAPPPVRVPSVVNYVVLDLRWWWTSLIVAWTLVRADERTRGALRAAIVRINVPRSVRRWAPEAALVAIALTWVVAGTPGLRFSADKVGDEPKYMRYCESFYQGLGFEVSNVRPLAELGARFKPHVWRNFRLIADTVPAELRDLGADALSFIGGRAPARVSAKSDGGFITGRNGGFFQLHNPGLSILLFPSYYLDRTFGEVEQRSTAQWPDQLPFVNSFLLALYALWVVLIYRFLRRCIGVDWASWITTLALTLTLPLAALPFQVYPEVAAGVLLLVATNHVLFPDGSRRATSFMHGLLLGYVPWIHVRFYGLVLLIAAAAVALLRRDRNRVLAFVAGVAVPLACLSLYVYRITGSVIPMSTYYVDGASEPLALNSALRGSVGYLVDRDWGLFAHSPVYLLALPGYWWLARRRWDIAVLSGAALFTLIATAAAHSIHAAGTTPMRLIVAVLPLGFVPMAESLSRWGRSRLFQISFALLWILSLHTALGYNLHNTKGVMLDHSFSGWKVNLLFPAESRWPWTVSTANVVVMIVWIAIVLALLLAPWLIEELRSRGWTLRTGLREPSIAVSAVAAVVCFVALGTAVSAAIGVPMGDRYLIPPEQAAERAALKLDEIRHCAICVSSTLGQIGSRAMLDRLENVAPSVAQRRQPGVRSYADWVAMPGRIRGWWVEANGSEPASSDIGHFMYQWSEERVAATEIQRRIFAGAGKPVPATR